MAHKTADALSCDITQIRPIVDIPLLFWLRIHFGIKKLSHNPENYDRVILVGPIWMGEFILPLKLFVKKYSAKINSLVFLTCCGSSYQKKDEKFGHQHVFEQVKTLMPEKCTHCEALPIALVIPPDKQEDGQAVMKTRLNDTTFNGEIEERFNVFVKKLQ